MALSKPTHFPMKSKEVSNPITTNQRIPHKYHENRSMGRNSLEMDLQRSQSSCSRQSIRCISQIPEATIDDQENDRFKPKLRSHLRGHPRCSLQLKTSQRFNNPSMSINTPTDENRSISKDRQRTRRLSTDKQCATYHTNTIRNKGGAVQAPQQHRPRPDSSNTSHLLI